MTWQAASKRIEILRLSALDKIAKMGFLMSTNERKLKSKFRTVKRSRKFELILKHSRWTNSSIQVTKRARFQKQKITKMSKWSFQYN